MVGPSVFRRTFLHAVVLVLALPEPAHAGYVMRRAEHSEDNPVSMSVTSDAQVKPAELPRDLPPDEGSANSTALLAAADGECSGCFVKWMGGKKKCMPADSLITDQKLKKCDDWKKSVCAMFPNAPYYSYRRRYLYAKIAHQYCPHTCAKYNDLCVDHSTEITITVETPAPTAEFLLETESVEEKPGKSTAHAKKNTALRQKDSAPDDGDDSDGDSGDDDDDGDDGGEESKEDERDDAIDDKEDAADAAEDANAKQGQAEEPAEERSGDGPHGGSLAEHRLRQAQVQLPPRPEGGKDADPDSAAAAKVDVGSMERQVKKIRDVNMSRKREAAEEKIWGAAKDQSNEGSDDADEVEGPEPDQEQETTEETSGDDEGAGGDAGPGLRQEEGLMHRNA